MTTRIVKRKLSKKGTATPAALQPPGGRAVAKPATRTAPRGVSSPLPTFTPTSVRENPDSVARSLPRTELSSPLTLYMRDAGEVPLLSPAEEIKLADRIRAGDESAREHMIRANLRFVIKIARNYEHLGLPLLDLINEGNIGLMLAVDRFDPRKGAKLSTYAALWIRQSIRRALASQGKTIRMPVYAADQVYHLGRAEIRLREQFGRDATEQEIADELGLRSDRLAHLRLAALRPTSLDAPLGDENSSRLSEILPDENAARPGDSLDRDSDLEVLQELLPKLPNREAGILRLRFGLDGGTERTLEQIGGIMRLTRERIRQLQNLALARLRRMIEERELVSMTA